MQAFENLKSEHSGDDYTRLQQISELLSSERVMAQKLSADFESYAASVTAALKKVSSAYLFLKNERLFNSFMRKS